MHIGERLRERREELGMTQAELAAKLGYASRSSINKFEINRDIPLGKIAELALALGVSEAELCGWQCEKKVNTLPVALTPTEREIIKLYRNADDITKSMIEKILNYERPKEDQ